MSLSSSLGAPCAPSAQALRRALVDRLAEPLRSRLSPEDGALLDALLDALDAMATLVAEAPASAPAPASAAPTLASLLGATSWAQLRVTFVDGHTVRVACGRRTQLRDFRELGFHARNSRNPTRKWTMLEAICAGHGTFRWQDFGSFHAVSQAMCVLRLNLQAAFGLPGDPFHGWDGGWRARFFASSEVGE